jgi:hypothetical protein
MILIANQDITIKVNSKPLSLKTGQLIEINEDQAQKLIQSGKFVPIENWNLRIVRQCLMNKGFHRTCLWGELLEADGKVLTICRSPQGGCRLRLQNRNFTTLIELKERRE